ncbi:MAG TPA: hypothetical protein V6D23_12125 [Candidatus Obscuribacterales bacterium]
MRKVLLLILMAGCWSGPALAATLPTDVVRVIKAEDDGLNWKMYDKKFGELKFDKKTLDAIKKIEKQLAGNEHNPHDRFRLTNVRIVANDVQTLIFRNDYGDTIFRELYEGGNECFLTFSGNGFSRCKD